MSSASPTPSAFRLANQPTNPVNETERLDSIQSMAEEESESEDE